MNSPSKSQIKKVTTEFSVLRPYPKILSLSHSFRQPFEKNYGVAIDGNFGMRKYRVGGSFEQLLTEVQWRYDCLGPIVRCLYLQLLSPNSVRNTDFDVYLSHLEVTLSDFKQLLVQEAVYLIVEAVKGYRVLQENFRKVSVNGQTIGVGCNGEPMVWINRFLEKNVCQNQFMTAPVEIIAAIVKQIKQRSEPVCRKLLTKLEEYILRQRPSFKEMLNYLRAFISKNGIKLPQNLKYLMNQFKIQRNFNLLQSMKTSVKYIPTNINRPVSNISVRVKCPKGGMFSQTQTDYQPMSRDYGFLTVNDETRRMRKYSADQPFKQSLRETLAAGQECPSPIGKTKKQQGRKWSCHEESILYNKRQTLSPFWEDKSVSALAKTRSKTDNGDNSPSLPYFLKPSENTLKNLKRSSGISQNTKPGNSFINKSNNSEITEFSIDLETVKKIPRKTSIQLEELSFREKLNGSGFKMSNLLQTSAPINSSFQPTFNCIPESTGEDSAREEVMSANNWTKTLKNLINTGEEKLNVSICDGKQIVCSYLSDVKLQKLDGLSRQMVVSMLTSRKDIPESQRESLNL